MRLRLLVSSIVVALLLATTGCAPPPPPKFRVLMVTDGGGREGVTPRPWQEWRDLEGPARSRLLDTPAYRLAGRLMDRGDMVIDVAGNREAMKPDNIACYDAFLADVGSMSSWEEGVSRILGEAVKRGAGLVVVGGAPAALKDDSDWCGLIGARVSSPRSEGPIRLAVLDPEHPATFDLGIAWGFADGLCGVTHLAPDARLLIRSATALPGREDSQPVAWTRQVGQGRVFVLTFGHEPAVRDRQEFVTVVHDAIRWAGHLVEERHSQLTLGERKAGFTLLFDGYDPGGGASGWSLSDGEWVGRLEGTRQKAFLAGSAPASLSDVRFDFKPLKGRASLRIERCSGGGATDAHKDLPLNDDLPAGVAETLWPDGWHQARAHVGGRAVQLWIDGLPAGSVPVGSRDQAKSASITWSLTGGPGSEMRLRDVKYRAGCDR